MKYDIAKMLKEAAPEYVSGREIGNRFNVSRAAIWKHMKELRQEGYSVEASTRLGYRLLPSEGKLSAWEISNGLGTSVVGNEILYFDTLDSTNKYAGKLASEGCREGLAVIAGTQTDGRGRLGRKWDSPVNMGIYLSVILRPTMAPFEAPILTLAAAIAVADAIRTAAGIEVGIKWPNDLVTDSRKVCGILLEMNSEADRVNYVIIGIGINYSQSQEDFPEELRDRAISLKAAAPHNVAKGIDTLSRLSVIQEVLRQLDAVMKQLGNGNREKILKAWREHSVTIGREVSFSLKGENYCGRAVGITEDGRLLVECTDGVRRELLSGEISVRGKNGYV